MNLIYAYMFKPTQIIKYVGKTNNLKWRRKQHEEYDIANPNKREYHYPLSRAFRKYGVETFEIKILEDNIPDNEVDQREIYWIAYYDTYYHGYNQTEGGQGGHHYEKFSPELIQSAKEMLKAAIPFGEISSALNISISHLSGINRGTKHHDDSEQYPLNNRTGNKKLTSEEVADIQNLLQNSNLKQSEIASLYNITQTSVSKINLGKTYFNENLTYPLRYAYKIPRY